MEQREGYKKTKIGWIPEEWDFLPLLKTNLEVLDGDRGKHYPKQAEFSPEGFCLFLTAKNVTKEGFQFIEKQFINQEKDSLLRKGKLQRDDVVITTRGTVGNIAWYNPEVDFDNIRINSGMAIIRKNGNEHPASQFVYLLLKSSIVQKQIELVAFGSAQPQLTIKTIKQFYLPLPPLPEQKKIASILTTVDDKISSIEYQIQQTEQLKKGLMEKLLTEGIGHTEFKETKIGRIPKGWDVVRLGEVSDFINGRGFKPHEWGKVGLPIIRIQNLNGSEEYNYYDGEYAPKILIKPGELLFAWSGSRGTSFGPHIWSGGDGLLNYHTWKVEYSDDILRDFLFYEFKQITAKIEREAHGAAALVHTQKKNIVNYSIPLPSLEEQKQIASILSTVDDKIEVLNQKKSQYQTLKKGLSQQLLTGQMRVKI